DPDRQPIAIAIAEWKQRSLYLVHRLHRIGQPEGAKAARQGEMEHRRQFRVHKRLAAGEADQLRAEPKPLDFVEIFAGLRGAQINEPVVLWRWFDIAMLAGQVTQRAGIEPERVEWPQRDLRAVLASCIYE